MAQRLFTTREDITAVIKELLSSSQTGKVAIISKPHRLESTSVNAWLPDALQDFPILIVDKFTANPDSVELQALREELAGVPICLWIAVGGGSAVDIMKLLSIFTMMDPACSIEDFLAGKVEPVFSPSKSIAIPTTAGSGSEATPFAVLYHKGIKYSLDYPELLPDLAVLLPETLKSLPADIRRASALDALCQAIESYWNINSTDESVEFAGKAIDNILPVIVQYVTKPGNSGIDSQMQQGAYMAGKAIAITRTTAPHAVSYPMTSHFNLPHGLAVALTLGEFFQFNANVTAQDCNDPRGPEFVKDKMRKIANKLGVDDIVQVGDFWRNLLNDIGVPWRISEHGIDNETQLNVIISEGFSPKRMNNNPRTIKAEQLRTMLTRLI